MIFLQGFRITHLFSIAVICVIYFQIYYHVWFMKIFGWEAATNQNVFFIVPFIGATLIYQLISLKRDVVEMAIGESGKRLIIPILLYFVFGLVSVIIHEEVVAIKTYLFYLFSPMLVCASVFGMYRTNENLKSALQILFVIGLMLSLYSMMLHWGFLDNEYQVINPVYHTKTGAVERFAFPGIPPNTFASMLIPILLIGLYLSKNGKGIVEYLSLCALVFLFYNLLETLSRTAFVSVLVGMAYFIGKGWSSFKKRTLVIIIIGFIIDMAIQKIFLLRALQTLAAFYPPIAKLSILAEIFNENVVAIGLAETGMGRGVVSWGGEIRIHMMLNSLSQIKDSLIFGKGFTNFVNHQIGLFDGSIDHNFYLRLTAQAGLIVFIPLAFFVFFLYHNASTILFGRSRGERKSGSNSRDIGILLLAGLLAFLVDLNGSPGFFHFYWIWFGFAAAWARNCEMEYRAASKASGAEAT